MSRHITPSPGQAERLSGADDGGPIVMVNLLRYRDRAEGTEITGEQSYGRYAAAIAPLLERAGARILTSLACVQTVIGPEDEHWDVVALVEYPSRQAFLEMVATPEYQSAHVHRDAGLADSRLILSRALVR